MADCAAALVSRDPVFLNGTLTPSRLDCAAGVAATEAAVELIVLLVTLLLGLVTGLLFRLASKLEPRK